MIKKRLFIFAALFSSFAFAQQPVQVTNFPSPQSVSASSLPLPTGAATSAKQPALGTAGTPSPDVVTVQGAASMTPLKTDGSATTQPVSAASLPLPSGAAQEHTAAASPSATRLTDGAAFYKPTTPSDTQPVSIAATVTTQDASTGATASAAPARAMQIAGTDGTNLTALYVDPCQRGAKTYYPVNISTATTVRFAAPTASKKTYVCSIMLVAAAADNVNVIEGTGGTCGTATAGVLGGTTAATGPNLAANGGFALGSGSATVFATAGSNVDMCLITSAAVQLSGHISFVQY